MNISTNVVFYKEKLLTYSLSVCDSSCSSGQTFVSPEQYVVRRVSDEIATCLPSFVRN